MLSDGCVIRAKPTRHICPQKKIIVRAEKSEAHILQKSKQMLEFKINFRQEKTASSSQLRGQKKPSFFVYTNMGEKQTD